MFVYFDVQNISVQLYVCKLKNIYTLYIVSDQNSFTNMNEKYCLENKISDYSNHFILTNINDNYLTHFHCIAPYK